MDDVRRLPFLAFLLTVVCSPQGKAAVVAIGNSPDSYAEAGHNQGLHDFKTKGGRPITLDQITLNGTKIHRLKGSRVEGTLSAPEKRKMRGRRSPDNTSDVTYLAGCADISSPGNYVISGNISSAAPCLHIHNTDHVSITCKRSTISSPANTELSGPVIVEDVQNVTISHCSMGSEDPQITALTIRNSTRVNIISNKLGSLEVSSLCDSNILGNTIRGYYQQVDSSYNVIGNNKITTGALRQVVAGIVSQRGSHNQFVRNQIDGSWDGNNAAAENNTALGADDGISLEEEAFSELSDNQIKNTWDAGIELTGRSSDLVISRNDFQHIYKAGVAAYHGTSWVDVHVLDNVATDVGQLWMIYYQDPWPAPATIYFKDNQFSGNVLRSPRIVEGTSFASAAITLAGTNSSSSDPLGQLSGGNNFISGNNFGDQLRGPVFSPFGFFNDGGGNICKAGSDNSAVVCL